MKKMITSLMLLGSILIFAMSAYSQNGPRQKGGGSGGHEPDYAKLKTELSLTDDQVASWKNLETQYKTKGQELHKNTTLSQEEKRSQMRTLQTSKETELKNILTSEQYTKYSSSFPQRKAK